MSFKTTGQRGFSLLETSFSIFLTFLILMALVHLLQQTSRAKSTVKEGALLAEIYHVNSLIRADLGAAQSVLSPLTGSSEELKVVTLVPKLDIPDRPTGVDPYLPEEQLTVRYRLVDGTLRRTLSGTGTSRDDALLKLISFTARRDGGRIDVDFGVENERRQRLHTLVFRVKP